MTPAHRAYHRKLANWFALLAIATLLLSGIALPPAQAAPDAPQATTVIAALSDYGSGETTEQTVANMIAGWNPARIVTAGDNYHYQNCSTYPTCVGAYYGTYVTAQTFMPTMGNHDYDNPPVGLTAWNNYFTWLPTSPDAQRRWYDFVVGDVHFFMLDGNGNQATQSAWLATAVPASTSVWNIAVIHQAPYSTGYYGDIAASQLPYGTYGIDFVISGHNHHYQRLVKADGGNVVRYFIDGYGGTDAANHSECGTNTSSAASEVCLADVPGALKITASDTAITFQYYASTGALQDTYTQAAGSTSATTATFQQGAAGYTGTVDTFIRGTTEGNTNYSANTGLEWDDNSGTTTDEITLIRFTGLFASEGGPIPNGATITYATLTYMTTNLTGTSTADGNPANVYESLVNWPGTTVTYNNFGGEAGVQTDEYNPTVIASALADALSTQYTINVTSSLQRWSDGTANYGWVFLPTASDGVTIYSSDFATVANHPLLTVVYEGAAGPTITTSGTLSAFSTPPGTPSAAQTYTVAGSNLTADISISAPSGFEISKDGGSTYSSSLTLARSGTSVPTTTISVRLTGAAEGSFSGNITHTSAGATTKTVAVSGTVSLCTTASFQQGTASYAGARDTYIQQANVTYNYGAATPLMVDSDEPNGSGNDVSALLYWDISAIPAGSTVESAAVTVYVENVTDATPGFDMYAMTQAWTEGTGNGSATADGATWNTYNGTTAWPGGAGGSSDRGTTALANFATTATGSYQVSLNSTGLTVLAGWINAPTDNKGFMVYAGTEDNGLDFTSKNGSTVANRPKLTVGYCLPPTTPYIVTSGTLSAFSSSRNVPSAVQSYTVSGGNLTGNIGNHRAGRLLDFHDERGRLRVDRQSDPGQRHGRTDAHLRALLAFHPRHVHRQHRPHQHGRDDAQRRGERDGGQPGACDADPGAARG